MFLSAAVGGRPRGRDPAAKQPRVAELAGQVVGGGVGGAGDGEHDAALVGDLTGERSVTSGERAFAGVARRGHLQGIVTAVSASRAVAPVIGLYSRSPGPGGTMPMAAKAACICGRHLPPSGTRTTFSMEGLTIITGITPRLLSVPRNSLGAA